MGFGQFIKYGNEKKYVNMKMFTDRRTERCALVNQSSDYLPMIVGANNYDFKPYCVQMVNQTMWK